MRRTSGLVALWFVAGALAAGIATAGVAVVDDQLTGSRPAPLTAAEVRRQVEAASSPTATTPTSEGATTSTAAPGTTSTTAAPSTGGTGTTTTSPTTATTASQAVTRTYELVGGTTTIRFSPSGVKVLAATPKPGFAAEVEPEGSGVKVEFESEEHQSRIDAWWAGGPQTETREEPH